MKILFFTPYFERTGSELFLLSLIEYLTKKHDNWNIKLITFHEGELTHKLPPSVEFISFNRWYTTQKSLFKQLYIKQQLRKGKTLNDLYVADIAKLHPTDVWYVNTIVTPFVLKNALPHIPIILHIHELINRLHTFSSDDISNLIKVPTKTICVSNACKNGFETLGLRNASVISPAIDWEFIKIDSTFNIRNSLKIHPSAFIWAMSGSLDFNKNPILFVEVLNALIAQKINTHFIWIGGDLGTPAAHIAMGLVKKYKLESHITFLGNQTTNYYTLMANIDGFYLSSTYESFSLVTLEALHLKKPVLVNNCGGVTDIVDSNVGTIIHTTNPNEIAIKMLNIMNTTYTDEQVGLRHKRSLKFNLLNTCQAIEKIIIETCQ